MNVLLDGQMVQPEDATISIFDRSVLFADSIYEVVAVYEGKMYRFDLHWERMVAGAREIDLSLPFSMDHLQNLLVSLIEANQPGVGAVYFQLTRGAAPRTHAIPDEITPGWFAFTLPPPSPGTGGAAAITMPDNRAGICYVKTTGLLPNCLAKHAASQADACEAILVRDGLVTEASSSSVFAVFDGELVTHPLANILPGITRKLVIDLAREAGINVSEFAMPLARFQKADEVFITGTMSEITPITTLDGQPVGTGLPGPITTMLGELYVQQIRQTLNL